LRPNQKKEHSIAAKGREVIVDCQERKKRTGRERMQRRLWKTCPVSRCEFQVTRFFLVLKQMTN
ncbi:unnamed protein product, partial [Linum tenue]